MLDALDRFRRNVAHGLRRWLYEHRLRRLCDMARYYDLDYARRYGIVLEAMHHAHWLGYKTGVRIDPEEPAWPVAYIELPRAHGERAQVSWHMPQHVHPWDGHDTAEKLLRLHRYASFGEVPTVIGRPPENVIEIAYETFRDRAT